MGEFFQNGFLGSPKGHPCWSILHKNLLKEDLKEKWYETYIKNIFRTVGPSIFTRSIYEYGIDKIDIITTPGAKYEAEGNAGIIDIRLKKDKSLGANGSLSTTYTQGKLSRYNLNASGNYRNKKVNIF